MGEFNQVLWTLVREIAPQDFERLRVDLLCRDGYWKIVPVGGTRDRGREAEASYWRGRFEQSRVVFALDGVSATWGAFAKSVCLQNSRYPVRFRHRSS